MQQFMANYDFLPTSSLDWLHMRKYDFQICDKKKNSIPTYKIIIMTGSDKKMFQPRHNIL